MKRTFWENSKQEALVYARRRPEETALYRIVYNHREELEYSWEQVFQPKYGALRKEVLKSLDNYLNCGILSSGLALAVCESCNETRVIAFSCKQRCLCPSCDTKRAYIFAENIEQNILLDQEHCHVVFSIPKRLRIYFRFNRDLNKYLYQAAWQSWKELIGENTTGKTAAVFALHTAGDLLDWHPHIHGIALKGNVTENADFEPINSIDLNKLELLFSEKIFNFLLSEELITEDVVQNMRSWQHSGFGVFVGNSISFEDKNKILFTARYLKKCPLSLNRLEILEHPILPVVRYHSKSEDVQEYRDFSPLEFLANLSLHIPDKWEQTVRYNGIYSAKTRGANKEHENENENIGTGIETKELEPETPQKPISQIWAIWIKKVFEVDPLVCPKCSSQMKIKSFVFKLSEINKITKHAGIPNWKPPPSLFKQIANTQYYCNYPQ